MNLIHHPWLPAMTRSGKREWITPAAIADPEIIDLAMPRADFQGAAYQWLLGLLQTAVSPASRATWMDWYETPPQQEQLAEAFAPFTPAFELDGEGPRFMQDYDTLAEARSASVASLLIEAPGDKGIKDNTDFFVKRGLAEHICPACAAIALHTMQANGPAVGRGYQTGLRGGGPLTTLILPEAVDSSLWRKLWLNMVPAEMLVHKGQTFTTPQAEDTTIFPWMGPTPTSETKGSAVLPDQMHPLHPYWSMPQRFRLEFEANAEGFDCDICGCQPSTRVSQLRTTNYGINYEGPWRHPLTPYRFNPKKPATPAWSQKGRSSSIDYRHWSSFLFVDEDKQGVEPALVVTDYQGYQSTRGKYDLYWDELQEEGELPFELSRQMRLWIFGFYIEGGQAKIKGWIDTQMPLLSLSVARLNILRDRVEAFVNLAQSTAREVANRIRHAWFQKPKNFKGDTSYLERAFFESTQPAFFQAMRELRDELDTTEEAPVHGSAAIGKDWYKALRQAAFSLFDEQALGAMGEPRHLERSVRQRRWLSIWLHGGSKKSKKSHPIKDFAAKYDFTLSENTTEQDQEAAEHHV